MIMVSSVGVNREVDVIALSNRPNHIKTADCNRPRGWESWCQLLAQTALLTTCKHLVRERGDNRPTQHNALSADGRQGWALSFHSGVKLVSLPLRELDLLISGDSVRSPTRAL